MRSLPPDVPEGPRSVILSCVQHHPGTHLRGLERMADLPLGQVLYHLDRLERMGLVSSKRDSGFRRYYVVGAIARGEKPILAALRHAPTRRIVLELLSRGESSHRELQEALGVAGSTMSFHLQRLVAAGVVTRQRVGASNLYALAEPGLTQRELVYYRASFEDADVDRFVEGLLAGLPAPASPTGLAAPEAAKRVPVEGPPPVLRGTYQ